MSSTADSTTIIEQTHPNAETVRSLREVADWLENHPELAEVYHATVSLRDPYKAEGAREALETAAAAMDEPTEIVAWGQVHIEQRIGTVRVTATTKIEHLLDEPLPVVPEYRPILPVGDQR